MTHSKPLRRGWTTGACATAAAKAAGIGLLTGDIPQTVCIHLPRGECPSFAIEHARHSADWAEAAVRKDAGDDPDVTHGALVFVRVARGRAGIGFHAGEGVGTVTKPGLPIPAGEPAINPVPRQMISGVLRELAVQANAPPDFDVTISIPGGQELAAKTWNPRLGIEGGLSILGTTGIVRPFSCAAWIASIHRGIDVARAAGLTHVAACTGSTSERAVQKQYGLSDHAMLDMGDFVGGTLKYLRRHPIPALTIGGGLAKLLKLGQGAVDLHSGRSQVDFVRLSTELGHDLSTCNSVLEAYTNLGQPLVTHIAISAQHSAVRLLAGAPVSVNVCVVDRAGQIIGHAE